MTKQTTKPADKTTENILVDSVKSVSNKLNSEALKIAMDKAKKREQETP